jgi:hypothetical protein
MILFGDWSLRKAIYEFVEHYHRKSNYPELGNRLISSPIRDARKSGDPIRGKSSVGDGGPIQRRQRLDGMLNYYYREAA